MAGPRSQSWEAMEPGKKSRQNNSKGQGPDHPGHPGHPGLIMSLPEGDPQCKNQSSCGFSLLPSPAHAYCTSPLLPTCPVSRVRPRAQNSQEAGTGPGSLVRTERIPGCLQHGGCSIGGSPIFVVSEIPQRS